jgi:hypothetical protein
MSTGSSNAGKERRNLMLPGKKIRLNDVRRQMAATLSFSALVAAILLLSAPGIAHAEVASATASAVPPAPAAAAVADSTARKPVSPHAIAARRHLEQLAAAKIAPPKNAAGQVPSALRPAHARHH